MTFRAPRSLFAQLVLRQAIVILVVAGLLPIVLALLLNSTAEGFIAARLQRDATVIAGRFVAQRGAPKATIDMTKLSTRPRDRGRHFAVFNADGSMAASGPPGVAFPFAIRPSGLSPSFTKDGRFDVLTTPLKRQAGQPQWVVVAQDRTAPEEIVDDVVRAFVRRFIWIVPASLLLSLLIGLSIVRRVTDNFREAASRADDISLERIDVRLDPEALPREAAPLVTATNRALDRLEAGYRYQGEFIGNVAHELRTPLALISLRTEGLEPSPERDLIQLGVERANHVIRQLMALAAIDRNHPTVSTFDPLELVTDIASIMAPLVFEKNHVLALDENPVPPRRVTGATGLIEIALTNLIDNAIRHTPPGSTVVVSVEADGRIVVEDDGPGLAIENYGDQSRRFRAAGTNRSDSAGIGLAIVERIMAVCGGSLTLGRSAAGGARCVMHLPPAPKESEAT